MKRDIQHRDDLIRLFDNFYSTAMRDERIGFFFTEVVKLDLAAHLPIIVDFWEKVLFGKSVYFGNPFEVHRKIHQRSPLLKEHFDRWLEIFNGTVDKLFVGELAETAKMRANVIAQGLFRRLNDETPVFLQLNKRY